MVYISLTIYKPMNAAFLSWLYTREEDGALAVRSDIFGGLLEAHVRTAVLPVEAPRGDNVFRLRLPVNDVTRALEDKWVYYSKSDEAALNMALDSVFDMDFTGYYLRGQRCGFKKKDIVEAYIQSRGLSDIGGFDTLHKRVYRAELDSYNRLRTVLLRRLYYIDETIDGINKFRK